MIDVGNYIRISSHESRRRKSGWKPSGYQVRLLSHLHFSVCLFLQGHGVHESWETFSQTLGKKCIACFLNSRDSRKSISLLCAEFCPMWNKERGWGRASVASSMAPSTPSILKIRGSPLACRKWSFFWFTCVYCLVCPGLDRACPAFSLVPYTTPYILDRSPCAWMFTHIK